MFEFIENVIKSTSNHANFYKRITSPNGICIICTTDFLPFCNLNNEEFLYTDRGKKLKFTHVAPKHVSNKTAFRRFYRSIFIN